MRPARRLLFRRASIWQWSHLQEEVGHWAGKQVRQLELYDTALDGPEAQEITRAVFKLFKTLPNLQHLSLVGFGQFSLLNFRQPSLFDHVDFAFMHSAVLFPVLSELYIHVPACTHSIVFALLATSNHQIRRLSVQSDPVTINPVAERQQLDFRGNLRYLSTDAAFYQTLLDPTHVALDGLAGLEELKLSHDTAVESNQREGGFIRVIAPTLRALSFDAKKGAWLTDFAEHFGQLTRPVIGNGSSSSPPFFRPLPPNLASLRFYDDRPSRLNLAPFTANPTLVPASLKVIGFNSIFEITTFTNLPRVDTLSITYSRATFDMLRRISPGTLPFKTLEVSFRDGLLDELCLAEAECLRLGVGFRHSEDPWDI